MEGTALKRRLWAGLVLGIMSLAGVAVVPMPANATGPNCPASNGAELATDLADANCTAITLGAGPHTSAAGLTAPNTRSLTILGPGAHLANITPSTAGH